MPRKDIVSLNSNTDEGICACGYGPIGHGKSESLLTLPDPLLIISNEPKDMKRTVKSYMRRNNQTDREVTVVEFTGFKETRDGIGHLKSRYEKGERPYQSIGFDTLSFASSAYKKEVEDDRFHDASTEIRSDGTTKRKDLLIDRYRLEMGDWGPLASMMCRITWMLNQISKYGVYVVCTSGMIENPSWNKAMEKAPAFQGKEYASQMAGYFDLVGLITKNPKDVEKGGSGYPPIIRFTTKDEDEFVCRNCCSAFEGKSVGLNWTKIIEYLNK